MTAIAKTFEELNQRRMALIHESAATGLPIDPAKIAELEFEMKQAQDAANLAREVAAARQTIEAEKRRTTNAEHLAELMQAVELKAEIADKLGAEIDAGIEALREKIKTWQAACREVENASGEVHHFGVQTSQSFLTVGVPPHDILIVVTRMTDYHKRALQTLGRSFKVYPHR